MFIFLFFLFFLLAFAFFYRYSVGFGFGRTVSHDDIKLVSNRYGLVGVPDRIVKVGRYFIPEEKKGTYKVFDSHRAQIGIYFILLEDHYGIKPPYGFIVLANSKREKIRNTKKLRKWVLGIVESIRSHKLEINMPLEPNATPAKCRHCGQKNNCKQKVFF